jgi:peroxiredoxin
MKKWMFTTLALAPALGQAQSTNCHITVKLPAVKAPAKAYLVTAYGWTNQHVLDSAVSQDGTFLLKGMAAEPLKTEIVIEHTGKGLPGNDKKADLLVVYLEKGNILVKGNDSVKYAIVTGSKLNAAYARYHAAVLLPAEKKMSALDAAYRTATNEQRKDSAWLSWLMATVANAGREQDSLKQVFIRKNPDSYFSLAALKEVAGNDMDVSTTEPAFKSLSPRLRNSREGVQFAQSIDEARITSIGAMAPDFTQNDVHDKPVKLSDFKGQYVLLDFWASWCGPCRAENPNVVKAYYKYRDKNFTVLGVSLDQPGKKAAWLAAIEKDGLPWTQVSDLNAWNNAAVKLYGIKAIPQNFLIDPTGKIVARNLRGDALNSKLEELLETN